MKQLEFENKGMSLIGLVVCISIIALLAMLSISTINALEGSLVANASANCVSSALGLARGLAAVNNKDVGVRFQSNDDGQYFIYVIKTSEPNAFIVVKNKKPIRLSGRMRLIEYVQSDSEINDDIKLKDKSCFTVIFSSMGKLIIREIMIVSDGDIFGSQAALDAGRVLFVSENDVEISKGKFFIYNKTDMDRVGFNERYTMCLNKSKPKRINRYTGRIIRE